ncbi:MAG: YceI family protein [Acidimicrobiia bacterium]
MATTQSTHDAERIVDGRSVPAAGAWEVDKSHSSVGFVARHLMVGKTRGRFADYDVDLVIGDRPEDSRVEVAIQAASITTGDDGRDGHLVSADFLDVENHPTLSFRTVSVAPESDDHWRVEGELTIVGVTRPVTLEVDFDGAVVDPWDNAKASFSAWTEFDREEFGLTWNQPLAAGGVLVGKKVKVEIEIEATRA